MISFKYITCDTATRFINFEKKKINKALPAEIPRNATTRMLARNFVV